MTGDTEQKNEAERKKSLFGSPYVEGETFSITDASGNKNDYSHMANALTEREVQEIIKWAYERKASDIWICGDDYVRCRFGSKKRAITTFKITKEAMNVILQGMVKDSGFNALQSGYAVDTNYRFTGGNLNVDDVKDYKPVHYEFRLNATGIMDADGLGRTFEISLRSFASEPPSAKRDLDIEENILNNFIVREGLNLVTGGTGNGKTTLIYAIYRDFGENPECDLRILDYAAPIEYRLPGNLYFPHVQFKQSQVGEMLKAPGENPSDDLQWREAGKNSLRRASDIINIAEARDTAAFRQIMESSNTGHLGVTTLHTNSVSSTFQRAVNFFPFEEQQSRGFDLIDVLNLVVCQRLLPRADGPGRVAVREYLVFSDAVKKKLINSKTHPSEWGNILQELIRKYSGKNHPACLCRSMADHAKTYPPGTFHQSDLDSLAGENLVEDL